MVSGWELVIEKKVEDLQLQVFNQRRLESKYLGLREKRVSEGKFEVW